MKISIQTHMVHQPTKPHPSWDGCIPVFHAVKDWQEAIKIADAISRQLGCSTVRLIQVPDTIPMIEVTPELVSRISGTYINAKP